MIDMNDSNDKRITINCYCNSKHCNGEIIIQPDKIKNERVFMVVAIDTNGSDEGLLWLSLDQLKTLREELQILIEEYNE
jgi:hypothetical protein